VTSRIRLAKYSDYRKYIKHHREAFPHDTSNRLLAYFKMKSKLNEVYVLELESKYVGHIIFTHSISPPFSDCVYVEEIVVNETYRSKGFGTLMLNKAIRLAKRKNLSVMLNTNKACKATRLYEQLGFKRIGSVKRRNKTKLFYELSL